MKKKKIDDFEEFEARREAEYDSISGFVEKIGRINKESSRLKGLFSNIDKNKKSLVFTTIDDVAFMTITMEDLRESMIREGTKVTYKNGENQYGTKQSPDAQMYLQLSQKQTQAMKLLLDCLPKNQKPIEESDGFDEFISGRDD